MTNERGRRRPYFLAVVFSALIGSGIVVPLIRDGSPRSTALPGPNVRAASANSFSLSTPVVLLDAPRIVLERGTVSLAAAKGQPALSGEALAALLAGGGADLVLDGARLIVDRSSGPGLASGADGSGMGPIVAALTRLGFRTLTLNEAVIVLRSAGGEETASDVTAELALDAKAVAAKGALRFGGEKLAFDVRMDRQGTKGDARLPIRVSVIGDPVDLRLEGRLTAGERLQITSPNAQLAIPKLREAARWLGADWPQGEGLAAFEAKGPLEWSEGVISFENAKFRLDGNTATGGLSLSHGAGRPRIEGTLAFDALDLTPYVPSASAVALAHATDWLSRMNIPGTAPSSLIREIEADLRLSAGRVTAGDQNLGGCAASVTIKDGKLVAEMAEIELENGGSGDGQASVDMTGAVPRFSVRGRLEAVDLGRLIGPRLGVPGLEGPGVLALDLKGEGRTQDAVMGSLTGTVEAEMLEGVQLGVDVDGLATMAALQHLDTGGWGAVMAGTTAVDSLVARLAANDGVLTVQTVKAETAQRSVAASGTVNLDDQDLDLTISVAPAEGAATPEKAGAEAGGSAAYRIRGPWQAPHISPMPKPGRSALPAERGFDAVLGNRG